MKLEILIQTHTFSLGSTRLELAESNQKLAFGNSNLTRLATSRLVSIPSLSPLLPSVTRILDPKKREIRVKNRLKKREKKFFCARIPFKKRKVIKTFKKSCFIAFD